MDSTTFPGIPAPFWFVELFKGIGFFLHLIPMHLWFAGLPLAILALLFGGPQAKRYSRRMFGQMPVFLALGVNFAIVPLLFLQTTYYKSFYTATILTAWFWLAIIPLFLLAYYGVYLCSFSIKKYFAAIDGENVKKDGKQNPAAPENNVKPGKFRTVLVGLGAWVCLAVIGVLIAHALVLMGRPAVWDTIWEQTQIGGAVTGLGNHFGNRELWLRLGGMFGLALLTTGFWAVLDSHLFLKGTGEKEDAYRKWTISYAARISWIGLIVSVSTFGYYFWFLDGNWNGGMTFLYQFPWYLFPATVIFLPFFLVAFLGRSNRISRPLFLSGLVLGEVGLLGSFVITRQLIQNAEVGRFLQVELLPISVQWSPLIAFLVVFVLGACTIAWIVRQIGKL
ncbi:MAG: hypothetical protein FWC43_03985 [Planctomycetaceae bacterium]|nr:hypothetical protein [Planctomycetaceae bacterium]